MAAVSLYRWRMALDFGKLAANDKFYMLMFGFSWGASLLTLAMEELRTFTCVFFMVICRCGYLVAWEVQRIVFGKCIFRSKS